MLIKLKNELAGFICCALNRTFTRSSTSTDATVANVCTQLTCILVHAPVLSRCQTSRFTLSHRYAFIDICHVDFVIKELFFQLILCSVCGQLCIHSCMSPNASQSRCLKTFSTMSEQKFSEHLLIRINSQYKYMIKLFYPMTETGHSTVLVHEFWPQKTVQNSAV